MSFDDWGWWGDDDEEGEEMRDSSPPLPPEYARSSDEMERRRRWNEAERRRKWDEDDRRRRWTEAERRRAWDADEERMKESDYYDYRRLEEDRVEDELEELRDKHIEVLENIQKNQRQVKKAHIEELEELEDLISRYEEVLDQRRVEEGYEDEFYELKEDYERLLDDHIGLLEDSSSRENSLSLSRFGLGSGSIITGLFVAEQYLPNEGVMEFYLQSPELYSESPELAAFTLGLPAFGVYMGYKALQSRAEYSNLRGDLGEYREKRRDS